MKKKDLEQAAFWGDSVCLRCQKIVEEVECPICGDPTVSAQDLLNIIESLDDPDENGLSF